MANEGNLKNLRRSLRYLWPYRARLALAMLCIVMVAVLWSGGIAMALPGLKVMLSPEGLHGWAWTSLTNDKLEGTFVVRDVPASLQREVKKATGVDLPPFAIDTIDRTIDPAGSDTLAKTRCCKRDEIFVHKMEEKTKKRRRMKKKNCKRK